MINSNKEISKIRLSFEEFIWIWNQTQGLSLPHHHRFIAKWLEKICLPQTSVCGLLMAFRNSGKSTLVGLFCAYMLLKNPNLRILIMAADYELAKKMVRNIKRIIERHPLTFELIPAYKDQWASDRFTIKRPLELRDASVLAKGLGANITGSRADIIICDDVEVPKTCDTPNKRQELRQKLAELDFVLTPKGIILYVGTPHTFYTIYSTKAKEEDNPAFLFNYQSLKIPIIDKQGNPAWPERFPVSKIKELKFRSGPAKFTSQMLLRPTNYKTGRLDVSKLKIYKSDLEYEENNLIACLKIDNKKMISVSAWWDPAWGKTKHSDNSVIACVFTDSDGLYRLHRIKYLKTQSDETDEATAQTLQVIDFIKDNYLPAIHIETNGLGKFLPAILKRELYKQGIRCGVIETNSKNSKSLRILEAFDAPLANHALLVHESVYQTPFIEEMREWIPEGKFHDDALDAVAGCLLAEPVRVMNSDISGQYRSFGTSCPLRHPSPDTPDRINIPFPLERKFQSWQGNKENYTASYDFEV